MTTIVSMVRPLAFIGIFAWAQMAAAQPRQNFAELRNKLVDEELVPAGIKHPRVLESVRTTPRHEFVPASQRHLAYVDMALPIGEGQTISPPFIVAYMTEQLDPQPEDKVLEIGTGSGYQAAILSPLVKEVYSIEIVEPLGKRAAATLKRLKYPNVYTLVGDGYKGWPEHAPFDKIIVTCSPEKVPQPLVDQLKDGGRMIIPLGERYQQTMYLYKKQQGKLVFEALLPTLFVPMTGAAEEQRQVKPDPLNPKLINGSFEQTAGEGESLKPVGWHYLRQATLVSEKDAPEGNRYLVFNNTDPGRDAQALQAFAIDGRQIRQVELSLWIRGKELQQGATRNEHCGMQLYFYDEGRKTIDTRLLGPWHGTFGWQQVSSIVRIPPATREVIVRVGVLGATGEAAIDNVELKVPK